MILGVGAALAAPITVDYAEEADLQFKLGLAAYAKRDYQGALAHLLASNRLVPNRNVVFNLARTYEQSGSPEAAWRYYQLYVQAETDPRSRAEAEEALARLTPKVARVSVTTDPPGAAVYVEREDLGSRGVTPLVLALPAGGHDILVERDGYVAKTQHVELAVGTLADLALDLVPRGAVEVVVDPVGGWMSTTVRADDLVLVRVEPGACAILPGGGPRELAAYVEPAVPLPPAGGSALAAQDPPAGLTVDLVLEAAPGETRTARLALPAPRRWGRRELGLVDPSALHGALFDRCVPTNGEELSQALDALPPKQRFDAMRLFGEWAAWRGAPDARIVAQMCVEGSCASIADRLTHP